MVKGEYSGNFLELGKIRIDFKVIGSSATYIALLIFATVMHAHQQSVQQRQDSLNEQQEGQDPQSEFIRAMNADIFLDRGLSWTAFPDDTTIL